MSKNFQKLVSDGCVHKKLQKDPPPSQERYVNELILSLAVGADQQHCQELNNWVCHLHLRTAYKKILVSFDITYLLTMSQWIWHARYKGIDCWLIAPWGIALASSYPWSSNFASIVSIWHTKDNSISCFAQP